MAITVPPNLKPTNPLAQLINKINTATTPKPSTTTTTKPATTTTTTSKPPVNLSPPNPITQIFSPKPTITTPKPATTTTTTTTKPATTTTTPSILPGMDLPNPLQNLITPTQNKPTTTTTTTPAPTVAAKPNPAPVVYTIQNPTSNPNNLVWAPGAFLNGKPVNPTPTTTTTTTKPNTTTTKPNTPPVLPGLLPNPLQNLITNANKPNTVTQTLPNHGSTNLIPPVGPTTNKPSTSNNTPFLPSLGLPSPFNGQVNNKPTTTTTKTNNTPPSTTHLILPGPGGLPGLVTPFMLNETNGISKDQMIANTWVDTFQTNAQFNNAQSQLKATHDNLNPTSLYRLQNRPGIYPGFVVDKMLDNAMAKNTKNQQDFNTGSTGVISQLTNTPRGTLFFKTDSGLIGATPVMQNLLGFYKSKGYVPPNGDVGFYQNPATPTQVLTSIKGDATTNIILGSKTAMDLGIPVAIAGVAGLVTGHDEIRKVREQYAMESLQFKAGVSEPTTDYVKRMLTDPTIIQNVYLPLGTLGLGYVAKPIAVGIFGARILEPEAAAAVKTATFFTKGNIAKIGIGGAVAGVSAYEIGSTAIHNPDALAVTSGRIVSNLAVTSAAFKLGANLENSNPLSWTRNKTAANNWDIGSYNYEINDRLNNLYGGRMIEYPATEVESAQDLVKERVSNIGKLQALQNQNINTLTKITVNPNNPSEFTFNRIIQGHDASVTGKGKIFQGEEGRSMAYVEGNVRWKINSADVFDQNAPVKSLSVGRNLDDLGQFQAAKNAGLGKIGHYDADQLPVFDSKIPGPNDDTILSRGYSVGKSYTGGGKSYVKVGNKTFLAESQEESFDIILSQSRFKSMNTGYGGTLYDLARVAHPVPKGGGNYGAGGEFDTGLATDAINDATQFHLPGGGLGGSGERTLFEPMTSLEMSGFTPMTGARGGRVGLTELENMEYGIVGSNHWSSLAPSLTKTQMNTLTLGSIVGGMSVTRLGATQTIAQSERTVTHPLTILGTSTKTQTIVDTLPAQVSVLNTQQKTNQINLLDNRQIVNQITPQITILKTDTLTTTTQTQIQNTILDQIVTPIPVQTTATQTVTQTTTQVITPIQIITPFPVTPTSTTITETVPISIIFPHPNITTTVTPPPPFFPLGSHSGGGGGGGGFSGLLEGYGHRHFKVGVPKINMKAFKLKSFKLKTIKLPKGL